MSTAGTVCVTGAAGYVGSWLVMKLLDRGYAVRAAVRDPGNAGKVKHLLELAGAEERLTLWKADLEDEGSYDEAVRGCDGVFHVASPVNLESEDPENEVIRPAVAGTLNVLRSCSAAKTVRRVVFTSSTAAVLAHETRKSAYEDDSWSDVEFCRAKKMTGWMYFVSKTLAEQAAWDFAEKNQLDLVSIVPSLINGPFLTPSAPPSMLTALALFQRNERHYSIINPAQLVHLDDLCDAHIFLFENANAEGRYICASHHLTITELARMLRERYPELDVQAEFGGLKVHDVITLSSKKLTDLGFSYKYSLEDMYDGAIRSCREKGLLPAPEVKPSSAET